MEDRSMHGQKGSGVMVDGSGATTAGKRTRWALRIGYAACSWALLFALVHLYWGIEATTGRFTVPGGTTAALGRGGSFAWALSAGIVCVVGAIVALLRFRGERMSRRMQLGAVGVACAAMTAYTIYAFTVNGFMWLLAAGVLFAAGAVIALALIQPWGRVIPQPLLLLFAWIGGTLLLLKTLYGALLQALAVAGVITWQQVQRFIGAPEGQAPTIQEGVQDALMNFLVWNPWFLLGGILFCTLAWLARRDLSEERS